MGRLLIRPFYRRRPVAPAERRTVVLIAHKEAMAAVTETTTGWTTARELDRRVVVVWTVQEAVGFGVLALLVLAVEVGARLAGADLPGPPGLVAGLIAVAGALDAWWLPRARYRRWRYQVAPDALELRHGVLKHVHSTIPYFRVQHIDIAQGPVERAVGLARLVVHTASAGTDATIPGIAAGDAEGLRRLILARAGSGDAV
jgi:membrane protein YdbS with pleckstrin-like domain